MNDRVLGERIRLARSQMGLSQEELAERINKDQKAISKYELGQRRIFATEIPKFAEALNMPIWYFFEDEIPDNVFDHELRSQFQKLPNQDARLSALALLRLFGDSVENQIQIMKQEKQ